MREQYEKLRSYGDGLKMEVLTVVPEGEIRGFFRFIMECPSIRSGTCRLCGLWQNRGMRR